MNSRIAVCCFALLVLGCAPGFTWIRADSSQADLNQDLARCEYEANSSTATYGSSMPAARGLGAAIGQGIGLGFGQAMQTNKLIALCMRAKGYAQAPLGSVSPAYATTPSYTAPPAPAYASNQPPSAPTMAAGLKTESKYLISAETLAKRHGCAQPYATMTAKGMGLESFSIGCSDGTMLAVNCEVDGCRILR